MSCFVHNPKTFFVIEDKQNQKILEFKKLQAENLDMFILKKMTQDDYYVGDW